MIALTQTRPPFAPKAYTISPSTVAAPRGPLPQLFENSLFSETVHSVLPDLTDLANNRSPPSLVPRMNSLPFEIEGAEYPTPISLDNQIRFGPLLGQDCSKPVSVLISS